MGSLVHFLNSFLVRDLIQQIMSEEGQNQSVGSDGIKGSLVDLCTGGSHASPELLFYVYGGGSLSISSLWHI